MRECIFKLKYCVFICFVLFPLISKSQQVTLLKGSRVIESTDSSDSMIVSRYLYNIQYSRFTFETSPLVRQPFTLNFQVPRVKIYNAADYYVIGNLRDMPFASWGPYQVPFHLNQPIVVPVKEKK